MTPEEIREAGIKFHCQRCTVCCRWPGDVRVTAVEIDAISGFLGMAREEFLADFTRLRTDRKGLSLVEKADDSCIFLEGNACAINEVKPDQCRGFPNEWNFPGWQQECEAIARPVPEQDS